VGFFFPKKGEKNFLPSFFGFLKRKIGEKALKKAFSQKRFLISLNFWEKKKKKSPGKKPLGEKKKKPPRPFKKGNFFGEKK